MGGKGGVRVAGAANQSWSKEGAEAKKGAAVGGLVGRAGVGWGGNLETTPARRGGPADIPRLEHRSRQCQRLLVFGVVFFSKKQNCWQRPERWKPKPGSRRRGARRPHRAAGTKAAHRGGSSSVCPRPEARPARGPAGPKSRTGTGS